MQARQQAIAQATEYVTRGVSALHKTFMEREIGMTVAGFKDFLLDVAKSQTDQTLAKSLYGTLTAQQKNGIHQLADIIVNKIVGQVSLRLKDGSVRDDHVLDALRRLYRQRGNN